MSKYIILLFALLILTSCEDFFTPVVDVELDSIESKLALNGILQVNEVIEFYLHESEDILGRDDAAVVVTDGTIDLYEDDVLLESLTAQQFERADTAHQLYNLFLDTLYDAELDSFIISGRMEEESVRLQTVFKYRSKFTAQAGKTYKVVANAPGFDEATASTTMPPLLPIIGKGVYFEDLNQNETYPINDLRLQIDFRDPANEENYYFVSLQGLHRVQYNTKNGGGGSGSTHFEAFVSQDVSLEKNTDNVEGLFENVQNVFWNTITLTDELFEGQDKQLTLEFPHTMFYDQIGLESVNETKHAVFAYFAIANKDFYLYLKSSNRQYLAEEDPFIEPVSIYSNVENGFGVVMGYDITPRQELVWKK